MHASPPLLIERLAISVENPDGAYISSILVIGRPNYSSPTISVLGKIGAVDGWIDK